MTKLKEMIARPKASACCGSAGYMYLAFVYLAGCFDIASKSMVEQAVIAVYLAIALRPGGSH